MAGFQNGAHQIFLSNKKYEFINKWGQTSVKMYCSTK